MGEPLFKASDGDDFEIARVTEDSIHYRLWQASEIPVPLGERCAPAYAEAASRRQAEAFTNGLPISIGWKLLQN